MWSEGKSKFPAYERVSLRHPGFPRPVVIFGPVADLARERLLKDYPAKFEAPREFLKIIYLFGTKLYVIFIPFFPEQDPDGGRSGLKSGIVRLSAIKRTMDRGKHALLDVTPSAVDKLAYGQLYPVVVLARTDSKQVVKECRTGVPK